MNKDHRRILAILNNKGEQSTDELANQMNVEAGRVARMLADLAREGYVDIPFLGKPYLTQKGKQALLRL